MKTLSEVKAEYLAKAKATTAPAFGYFVNGQLRDNSSFQGLHAEFCAEAVTAKIESKWIVGGRVKDEAPIEVVSAPETLLGGLKSILAFTTPGLGENNLKVELVERNLIGANVYRFHAGHNFASRMVPISEPLLKSAIDGSWYLEANLPEQDDAKVTEKYSAEVKSERNSRISDTDALAQTADMTVKVAEGESRRALTEEEREELLSYRQALRDLTAAEGFPFCDYPTIPACIRLECEQKIAERERNIKRFVG